MPNINVTHGQRLCFIALVTTGAAGSRAARMLQSVHLFFKSVLEFHGLRSVTASFVTPTSSSLTVITTLNDCVLPPLSFHG